MPGTTGGEEAGRGQAGQAQKVKPNMPSVCCRYMKVLVRHADAHNAVGRFYSGAGGGGGGCRGNGRRQLHRHQHPGRCHRHHPAASLLHCGVSAAWLAACNAESAVAAEQQLERLIDGQQPLHAQQSEITVDQLHSMGHPLPAHRRAAVGGPRVCPCLQLRQAV